MQSGGTIASPSAQERLAASESHVQPTSEQMTHEHSASADRSNFASENHGKPANAAMSRVGERANNQQDRIANGVRSGQLTAGETKNLESREANINHEVKDDRAANGDPLPSRRQVRQASAPQQARTTTAPSTDPFETAWSNLVAAIGSARVTGATLNSVPWRLLFSSV